jgi:hypothetical protein
MDEQLPKLGGRVDSARSRQRITKAAAVAVMATSACLGSAFIASPAVADEEHAFDIEIQEPDAVAPGASGLISYTLTNASDEPTDGVLMNISLPPQVTLNTDSHCQQTGQNPEGGQLISCNFSDAAGKFAPGETFSGRNDFTVAADAPQSASLGKLGALVVPLEKGEPTEDWTDLEGDHVDWVEIKTAAGSAGPLEQLRAFFGL